MKRSLLFIAALFVLLLGAIAAFRALRSGDEDVARGSSNAERIRRFWDAYHQATTARTGGDFEGAAALYRIALELDPAHEESLFYLAIALEETGRYAECADVLRRLVSVNPESGRGWSQLGSVLARRAPGSVPDREGARMAFEKSQAINPEQSGPFLDLGLLALDGSSRAEARRFFRIASDMGSPEGAFLSGLVAYLEKDEADAARFFTRVVDAAERERAISGRGATSEGDVLGSVLTPLESAEIRSRAFLDWVSRRRTGRSLKCRVETGDRPLELDSELHVSYERTLVDEAIADFDSDGKPDTYLLFWKVPGRLLRSTGTSYEDVTGEMGLAGVGGEGFRALFFDFDGDSDPDLLVTAHAPLALSLRRFLDPERRARTLTPRLFRNDDGRRFVEVTSAVGLDRHFGVTDALAHDVDADGDLDLVFAMGGFEATHLEPSVVLRNREGRSFEEWAYLPSIDEPRRAVSLRLDDSGAIVLLEPIS